MKEYSNTNGMNVEIVSRFKLDGINCISVDKNLRVAVGLKTGEVCIFIPTSSIEH
jgi:hypothetical protein